MRWIWCAGLRTVGDFDISVAAYPEVHPEAPSPEFDLDNLKRKLDAGANRAITQFFFDTDNFLRFRDRCAAAGIGAPIVPGLLPISRFSQMLGFAGRCGANVPQWLHERFAGLDDDAEIRQLISAHVAIEQVQTTAPPRGQRVPFLYAESRGTDLRDLLCHGPAPAGRNGIAKHEPARPEAAGTFRDPHAGCCASAS